jgi:phosphocarrier protein
MSDNLIRVELRVADRQGLHARPAAQLVELANTFRSQIELVRGTQRVDAKSIIDILTLAADHGTLLILEARGADAQQAATAIDNLFKEWF